MYVPLDVNFPDDDKIEAVGLAGAGLYAQALCVAKRVQTDGRLTMAKLRKLGADEALIDACVRADLFRREGEDVQIVAWLDHNESAAEVEVKRAADAKRKRLSRGNRPRNVQPDTQSESARNPPVEVEVQVEGQGQGEQPQTSLAVVPSSPATPTLSSEVEQVFAAWVASTGKQRARLDPKRRRRIEAALKGYPLADVLDAVRGWENLPFNGGQNDSGMVYNELELLLRDAAHIERYRDAWRSPPKLVRRATNADRNQAILAGTRKDFGL